MSLRTEEQATSWTEFGATVDYWNSAHEPDTRYPEEGCCYLPGPKSAGGRYGVVLADEYDGGGSALATSASSGTVQVTRLGPANVPSDPPRTL
jgi:hypothetical protein